MYEIYYHTLEPYGLDREHLHYMDSDSFVLSFDANNQKLTNFLQQNKDAFAFDFSDINKSHELYDPINTKGIGKLKIETSTVLVLDSFTALRSKSFSFSYQRLEAYDKP